MQTVVTATLPHRYGAELQQVLATQLVLLLSGEVQAKPVDDAEHATAHKLRPFLSDPGGYNTCNAAGVDSNRQLCHSGLELTPRPPTLLC